jgi:Na+-transporting methylmalonyl-CoA/oxaloacetate decarboxylase gamma subunit
MMMNTHLVTSIAGMGFAILFIALIVVVIVALIKVWQTKVQTAKEEMYQKLAIDATEAQQESVRQQEKLIAELSEIKERLASIERILKEVE